MQKRSSTVKESKYQQIAIEVAKRIADGDYEAGEKLKSRSTLSAQFNVSPETTRKALNILADLKIVTLKHGSGAIVLSQEKAIEFLDKYESTHSIAVIKERIRKNIKDQQEQMEDLSLLVNEFLLQSQSISRQYPLTPYEIIVSQDTEHFGKPLSELNIWHLTGATIIAIEHEGEFVLSPGPYGKIEKGDHVYFVGSNLAYSRMKTFFNLKMGL
ncbi:K+/H+ antiporter YhaU regulatory subunit KhtT [Streptococcus gallinaceus]|uniref:GntR family transcriptional regulator n=1 Tax=Streptococcus gallinaceus TaxID=165758 RepID=UPI00209C740B|nr:GntR family transcriptional regulator [Streptococcus gallinaceus]MCP1640004.1 K+/H+ antiporter YhaU regulatory subunit KhtT [Streptococcus gallinaceus]MCP1770624.1 K+/H+ antiporter YhaU regulatory subunit KhtT [Streptococcus gallinaceus]